MQPHSPARPLWLWVSLSAVTMALGWALRGYIGGGPLGAMIPGAMIGLALCLLLNRESDAAAVAAFAAIGTGFGGEMTYGQTVGLSFQPATYWWAILGFAIKGGAWGLLGGVTLGLSFVLARLSHRDRAMAFLLLCLGTWAGWKFINDPKLIYFSHPTDKPRPEVWAGLIVGALVMWAFVRWRTRSVLPGAFALWGAASGAAGFSLGAMLQVLGRASTPGMAIDWWKVMELTFGALLGLGYGYCAWRHRGTLSDPESTPPPEALPLWPSLFFAVAGAAALIFVEDQMKTSFNYVLVGALLLTLAPLHRALSWQLAISVTYCAFAIDLLEARPQWSPQLMWALVILTTAAVVYVTTRRPRALPMFLLITWTAVGDSLVKSFVPWTSGKLIAMEGLFVLMAVLIHLWTGRAKSGIRLAEIPSGIA